MGFSPFVCVSGQYFFMKVSCVWSDPPHYIKKKDQPLPRNQSKQQLITDTDKVLGLEIVRASADRQTDRQTDGWTLPNILSPVLCG